MGSNHAHWLLTSLEPNLLADMSMNIGQSIIADRVSGVQIEAIAVCGTSGLIMGGAVSAYCGVPLVVVRKNEEPTHSTKVVEYYNEFAHYAFLDDFIASGDTIVHVMRRLGDRVLTAVYLYAETEEDIAKHLSISARDRLKRLTEIPIRRWSHSK